jgi:S1-C subfamily serine protease
MIMKRRSLYSASSGIPRRSASAGTAGNGANSTDARNRSGDDAADARDSSVAPAASAAGTGPARRPSRLRRTLRRGEKPLLLGLGGAVVLGIVLGHAALQPKPRELTQDDIDKAVRHSLEEKPLPSWAAKAYDIVRPSVVKVRDFDSDEGGAETVRGVGTGVVIVDKGVILTNLHVVAGAKRVQVLFFDGTESDADVIGTQPENDLAVLQARTLPDDLQAATLRSTADLNVGDEVMAVGYPFGIGPSASTGVVSGLRREYRSPEGERVLTNLIQFDAAANPGNSGGPLVTAEGEVVGIVTGILNPTNQRFFVGIGFAVPIENAASAFGTPPF